MKFINFYNQGIKETMTINIKDVKTIKYEYEKNTEQCQPHIIERAFFRMKDGEMIDIMSVIYHEEGAEPFIQRVLLNEITDAINSDLKVETIVLKRW